MNRRDAKDAEILGCSLAQSEEIRKAVARDGYAVIPRLLDQHALNDLDACTRNLHYGKRNLLSIPQVRELAGSNAVRSAITQILGEECFAVRSILFDKTEESNWKVPWHQDRVIAVKAKTEVDGFRLWSVKAGVNHVQPTVEIMSRMVALRLHLDDCGEENGPLRVLPGSHLSGFLSDEQVRAWKNKKSVSCTAGRGDAILMRPLLLHASSPCILPRRRRVIHVEFAAEDLPGGLEWHDRVQ